MDFTYTEEQKMMKESGKGVPGEGVSECRVVPGDGQG